jgi:hypothetical protein
MDTMNNAFGDAANAASTDLADSIAAKEAELAAQEAALISQREQLAAQKRMIELGNKITPAITALQTGDPAIFGPAIDALRSDPAIFPKPVKAKKDKQPRRTKDELAAAKELAEVRTEVRTSLNITGKGRMDKDTQAKFNTALAAAIEKRKTK